MIKTEIINAKIKNRILEADAPIFSGETVTIKLDFDSGDADASKYKIVLFGDDKTALAEGAFTANAIGVWVATLNTATDKMAAYFADVPAEGTKSVGAMVIDAESADVISRGNILVVSTPFPNDLTPLPKVFDYVTDDELEAAIDDCESSLSSWFMNDLEGLSSETTEALNNLAASFDTQLSGVESSVSDLRQDVGNWIADASSSLSAEISNTATYLQHEFESSLDSKADASELEDLSSTVADVDDGMRSLAESLRDLDTAKADVETVENLAEASERKREVFEAETVAEKVNLTSSDLAENWYYLTSDTRRDSCLMRIYFDDSDIESGTTSTIRQFSITFPHLPNREEIQYSNDGPNGNYSSIFDLVAEFDRNFQPPSAEGWYTYRFNFCPWYDFYFAELLSYRPI